MLSPHSTRPIILRKSAGYRAISSKRRREGEPGSTAQLRRVPWESAGVSIDATRTNQGRDSLMSRAESPAASPLDRSHHREYPGCRAI